MLHPFGSTGLPNRSPRSKNKHHLVGAGFRVTEERNSWSRLTSSMKERMGILPLAAQAKLLDDRLVTVQIRLLEVIKEFSPTGCHHQQAASGMEILAVRFQVFRKMSDTGGEQSDLHFT